MSRPIKHHGVKGMKWGVRKDRSGGGSKSSGGAKSSKSKLTDAEQARVKKMTSAQTTEAYQDYANKTGKKDFKTEDVTVALKDYLAKERNQKNRPLSKDHAARAANLTKKQADEAQKAYTKATGKKAKDMTTDDSRDALEDYLNLNPKAGKTHNPNSVFNKRLKDRAQNRTPSPQSSKRPSLSKEHQARAKKMTSDQTIEAFNRYVEKTGKTRFNLTDVTNALSDYLDANPKVGR